MDQAAKAAEFLQTFGGWGVSVVLLVGIIYLYRTMNTLLERRNQQIIDVLRETTAMLQQNVDFLQRAERLLERVERFLDN